MDEAELNPLKLARVKSGLSLRELAEKSNVAHMTIYMLESGQRKAHLKTLYTLAEALQMPVGELLGLQDHTSSERGRKGAQSRATRQRKQSTPNEPKPTTTTSKKNSRKPKQSFNFWLVINKDRENLADAETHGPLTEKSAQQLATSIAKPTRIYQAANAAEANKKHLAWLTEAVRHGDINAWFSKHIQK